MPAVNAASDLPNALAAVASAVAAGRLSPEEAQALASVLNAQARAIEIVEIDTRLRALEQKAGNI
jgi:hypothetical protein